jgi:hypothetical protein
MSAPELFPLDAVFMESPRLKWMKRHKITTHHEPRYDGTQDSPETGQPLYPWTASREGFAFTGTGHTENDALVELANYYGIPLWNVGGFK